MKKIELPDTQLKELRKLARAQKAAEEAKEIRAHFKSFTDNNEDALRDGLTVDGLTLGIKISKQLVVNEEA